MYELQFTTPGTCYYSENQVFGGVTIQDMFSEMRRASACDYTVYHKHFFDTSANLILQWISGSLNQKVILNTEHANVNHQNNDKF